MTIAPPVARPGATTFESLDPATGENVGTFPIDGPEEVQRAVSRAREAAAWWGTLTFAERRTRLNALAGELAHGAHELADLVHRENGKPWEDAMLEIVLGIDHVAWAAGNAKRVLGLRKVGTTAMMANYSAYVEYLPVGVVGVIGPWNYPVFTPMGSICYALAAGNAVVFKPSEYTPAVGRWLGEACRRAIPEQPLLQIVTGLGDTGAHLCRSGVDKLAFTGSGRTGRKVMAACSESLTPVVLELGGKDALIVAEDADLDRAANAAVWGGLQNAGQACISLERVYVADAVYDDFLAKVVARARHIHVGSDRNAKIGPITMPSQVEVIKRHLEDAIRRGAHAVVGGLDSVRGTSVDPVVLTDVPEDAPALTEETFGPTLPIVRVRDADEAVERANRSAYGLGSAVFSKRRGMELARRMRAGMTAVNSAASFAAIPSLPFGGIGESGFGRIHGDDGLREFSRPHAISRQRFALPVEFSSFDRPPIAAKLVAGVLRLRHRRRKP